MDKEVSFSRYARSQITWKISNVSVDSIERSSSSLETSVFQINLKNHSGGFATTKWKFKAYRNRGTLSLYLEASDQFVANPSYKDYRSLVVNYEMKLKDAYGQYRNRQKGKIENRHYLNTRLGKIISVADLNKRTSYQLLSNKTLEVVVNLDIIEGKLAGSAKNQLNISQLSSQFENLYYNEKHSDFTLITVDKEEIPVHKNILSTRSPVFDAMVETKLKEGEEKKALIDDIDSVALKEFLRFLYCARVNDIDPIATDLLYAAEKYDLKDLKPLCVRSLTNNICLNNALDTFILANLHDEKELKKYSLDFILWHYVDLKEHESWKKMPVELMKEILDYSSTSQDKINSCITLSSSIAVVARPTNAVPAPVRMANLALNANPPARLNVAMNLQPARLIQPIVANANAPAQIPRLDGAAR